MENNEYLDYMTVAEFIAEFRAGLGDTTQEIPEPQIIAHIRKSIPRLAREKGVGNRLFMQDRSYELASVNKDGTASAAWTINAKMGAIIDIEHLLVLDTNGACVTDTDPKWMSPKDFRKNFPAPETVKPGRPCYYTLLQIGGRTKIIFDKPMPNHVPYVLDILFSVFPPRITSRDQYIQIPTGYVDILNEAVTIQYNLEAADAATARGLYEDYDKMIAEARELLNSQYTAAGPRFVKGAF